MRLCWSRCGADFITIEYFCKRFWVGRTMCLCWSRCGRLGLVLAAPGVAAAVLGLLASLHQQLGTQCDAIRLFSWLPPQGDSLLFNRGALLNAGALLLAGSSYDYFVFQVRFPVEMWLHGVGRPWCWQL